MKRFRYGNNFQTFQATNINTVAPLGYLEVSAGDTIHGSVQAHVISDVAKRAILNRCYFDVAAFYVPFRLLWDGFPEWLLTSGTSGTVPTVNNALENNFEPLGIGSHPAWFRRAYNLIWNQFYRSQDIPELTDLDNQAMQLGEFRKSTFYESIRPSTSILGATAPVDGSAFGSLTVDIDKLRKSFTVDRINKIRSWYGTKYTDFLSSLGVEASWSILDEPEVIGKKTGTLKFKRKSSSYSGAAYESGTSEFTPLGAPAGNLEGQLTIPIRRTFCPEHGLIAVMGITRLERINTAAISPTLLKDNYSMYWLPEHEFEKEVQWPAKILGTNTSGERVSLPPFEDLRKGTNLSSAAAAYNYQRAYMALYTDADPATYRIYTRPGAGDYSYLFQGYTSTQLQSINTWRMVRHSPLKPPPRPGGVA